MLRRFGFMLVFCLAFVLLTAAFAADEFSVSLPETVRGYTPVEIRIVSPEAGEAELRLYDVMDNLWLTRREHLSAGENRLAWDGLGENRERLFAGPYRFAVKLRTEDGREYTAKEKFDIRGTTPALVYALPSSYTLYLSGGDRWFTEVFVSAECTVVMVVRDGKGKKVFSRQQEITDPDGESIRWNGTISGKKKIAPGDYTVLFHSNRTRPMRFPSSCGWRKRIPWNAGWRKPVPLCPNGE